MNNCSSSKIQRHNGNIQHVTAVWYVHFVLNNYYSCITSSVHSWVLLGEYLSNAVSTIPSAAAVAAAVATHNSQVDPTYRTKTCPRFSDLDTPHFSHRIGYPHCEASRWPTRLTVVDYHTLDRAGRGTTTKRSTLTLWPSAEHVTNSERTDGGTGTTPTAVVNTPHPRIPSNNTKYPAGTHHSYV